MKTRSKNEPTGLVWRTYPVGSFFLLASAVAISGCGKKEAPAPPVLRPVYTFTVAEPVQTVNRSFSGLVEAADGADLSFEVGGRVIEVIASSGKSYKKGDELAILDISEFENQLSSARAQMLQAQQARQRTSNLLSTGNASKSDMESAISAEKAAQSTFKSAEKKVNDAVLKMPYDGVIGSVDIDSGQIVDPGKPAITIQGESGMKFKIGVPSDIIDQLKEGMKAIVKLGDLPEIEIEASISTIAPQPNENTTYPVKLIFGKQDPRFRKGMDGEASMTLSNPQGAAIVVPISCVAKNPELGEFVWIVNSEDGKVATVSRQAINTGGIREGGTIEVSDGLTPKTMIVSRGVHQIEEGQKVRLSNNQ